MAEGWVHYGIINAYERNAHDGGIWRVDHRFIDGRLRWAITSRQARGFDEDQERRNDEGFRTPEEAMAFCDEIDAKYAAEVEQETDHEEIPAEIWYLRDSDGKWVVPSDAVYDFASSCLSFHSEQDAEEAAAVLRKHSKIDCIPVRVK